MCRRPIDPRPFVATRQLEHLGSGIR